MKRMQLAGLNSVRRQLISQPPSWRPARRTTSVIASAVRSGGRRSVWAKQDPSFRQRHPQGVR